MDYPKWEYACVSILRFVQDIQVIPKKDRATSEKIVEHGTWSVGYPLKKCLTIELYNL